MHFLLPPSKEKLAFDKYDYWNFLLKHGEANKHQNYTCCGISIQAKFNIFIKKKNEFLNYCHILPRLEIETNSYYYYYFFFDRETKTKSECYNCVSLVFTLWHVIPCRTHIILVLYQPFPFIIFQELLVLPCCIRVRTRTCVHASQVLPIKPSFLALFQGHHSLSVMNHSY